MTTELLIEGTPTGLRDSAGRVICVGNTLKVPVDCNVELHGEFGLYEVKAVGVVPFLSYVRSAKGQILPAGYLAGLLTDYYDVKMLLHMAKTENLRPTQELEIVPHLDEANTPSS